jgi:hypothetical protein
MISKKLKFRQYEIKSSYQKKQKSKLVSSSKSYQPKQKSRIDTQLQREKFKVYRQQVKISSSYQPKKLSRLDVKISPAYYPKIKKSSSYPKKYYDKEYALKQSDIELSKQREIEEERLRNRYFDEQYVRKTTKEYKEPHRHTTNTYECLCLVSDRKLTHLFGVRDEVIDIFGSFEAVHADAYPDHSLINFTFKNVFSIEDKSSYYNDQMTENQKDFLHHLGFSREEISLVTNKKMASRIISKRR